MSEQVAILGVGKTRVVPAFEEGVQGEGGTEGMGRVVRREVGNFSWSADHRVVDGATLARAAERVREMLEEPGLMVLGGR